MNGDEAVSVGHNEAHIHRMEARRSLFEDVRDAQRGVDEPVRRQHGKLVRQTESASAESHTSRNF